MDIEVTAAALLFLAVVFQPPPAIRKLSYSKSLFDKDGMILVVKTLRDACLEVT